MDIEHMENDLSEIAACLESTDVLLHDMDEEHNSRENILRLYTIGMLVSDSLKAVHSMQDQLLTAYKEDQPICPDRKHASK